jgi:hypothetical protein
VELLLQAVAEAAPGLGVQQQLPLRWRWRGLAGRRAKGAEGKPEAATRSDAGCGARESRHRRRHGLGCSRVISYNAEALAALRRWRTAAWGENTQPMIRGPNPRESVTHVKSAGPVGRIFAVCMWPALLGEKN